MGAIKTWLASHWKFFFYLLMLLVWCSLFFAVLLSMTLFFSCSYVNFFSLFHVIECTMHPRNYFLLHFLILKFYKFSSLSLSLYTHSTAMKLQLFFIFASFDYSSLFEQSTLMLYLQFAFQFSITTNFSFIFFNAHLRLSTKISIVYSTKLFVFFFFFFFSFL